MRWSTTMEKDEDSVCDETGAVKGGPEGLNRGPNDGPWTASTWTCPQAIVHARMVMETVLTKVKMATGPSQGGCASTW